MSMMATFLMLSLRRKIAWILTVALCSTMKSCVALFAGVFTEYVSCTLFGLVQLDSPVLLLW